MFIESNKTQRRVTEAAAALAYDKSFKREGEIDQAAGSIPRWYVEPNGWDEV